VVPTLSLPLDWVEVSLDSQVPVCTEVRDGI
jgi:hypothetical protein